MNPEDASFAEAVESCRFPGADFHHREHVRLAWIYLRSYGRAGAEERIAQTIRRYAAAQGAAQKYHHTITMAWMRLVEAALARSAPEWDFDAFAEAHPGLFVAGALERHYSQERLQAAAARTEFVAADRAPLEWPE